MNKRLGVIVMLCFAAFAVKAQNNISGTVKNENGEAVSHAAIRVKQTYLSTQSNAAGEYALKNLKDGVYIVETFSMGYKTQVDTVTITGSDVVKDIQLIRNEVVIDEVLVQSTRANSNSGFAYSTLNKEDIQKQNLGQDVPYLLNNQASVVVTSDAGTGIGYTGIRIRGTDASRINVTVNGIPTNDAESQGTYWVDFPDLASSTNSIQVQRGVGSSTNGAGAFGGSINIQTNTLNTKPYADIITSGGSFNTLRTTLNAGTGLLNEHWALDARASRISSDGFIDRGYSRLYSWYLSGGYYGKKTTIKGIAFSGNEQTYQAWWGIPETKLNGEPKDSLLNYLYNNLSYVSPADTVNIKEADNRTYNIYTYKNQTDNYKQDNYQLHFIHEFSDKVSLNIAGHYTKGKGYYEEFKYNQDLINDYGIDTIFTSVDTTTHSDLIRRKWLNNDFFGAVYSLNIKPANTFRMILGGGANKYIGQHYGEIIWARNISSIEKDHRYYNDTGFKTDINNYLKLNYEVTKNLNLFADLQYRYVNYNFVGIDYNYGDSTQTKTFNFFNPKAGLSLTPMDNVRLYASFSMGNREPNRDDFTENKYGKQPKAESLQDVEVGISQNFKNVAYTVNLYNMQYKNQLVLTGELNDVGNSRRMNVDKSFRRGIEVEAGGKLGKFIELAGNITLSQNKIENFNEIVANYDVSDYQDTIIHKLSDIAYSPNVVSSVLLTVHPIKNFDITFINKYVGKQYLDNTSNEKRKLDPYYVADLRLAYLIKFKGIREMRFTVSVNNIFNKMYSSNGYTYGWIYGGRQYTYNHYYPQAGTNILGGISISF